MLTQVFAITLNDTSINMPAIVLQVYKVHYVRTFQSHFRLLYLVVFTKHRGQLFSFI